MARELSQAELLDFLCQAGGRVANAALLDHFKGFLRDPAAGPEELRRRRELFKGFVNSVASVRREGPGGATAVVLRKRYRELVGEEPPPAKAQAGPPPAAPRDLPGSPARRRRGPGGAHEGGGERVGTRPAEEEAERPRSRTCGGPPRERRASPAELEGRAGARLPAGPAPGAPPSRGGPESLCPAGDPPALRGGAPQPNGERGAPPGGLQQRVRAWVAAAHEASLRPDAAGEAGPRPARPSPPASPPPDPPLERPPVFRSIRCQLSLQDLDEFLEQESPASEDSSSASGGSDSCRAGGEPGAPPLPAPAGQNGCLRDPLGVAWTRPEEGLPGKPRANGLGGAPPGRASGLSQGAPVPGPGQITRGSPSEDEPSGKDSRRPAGHVAKARKVAPSPSPKLDAPLSPLLAPRPGFRNGTPSVEGLVPDPDDSPEHRSSLVPLEPREHAWLVKVAAGSWLQVRALFLEDPHLATRKDFISGYTVLHWLAKHGNAQLLLDFVAGARRAGVALDVDVKSGCGYTPLHLAAMHGHRLVIRLLVQKLQCQIRVRDCSGKRPWQYLSSSTSGEIWQLLGAPQGRPIFLAHTIPRDAFPARRGKSPELARKITRKTSLAAYLKPQHIKWKMANKYPALQEREEYSD